MKLELVIGAACLAFTGCSATCLRDSDCVGAALCKEDRCILVVKGDAGRGASPTPAPAPDSVSPTAPDASTGPAGSAAGGSTTPDRTIVDAARSMAPPGSDS